MHLDIRKMKKLSTETLEHGLKILIEQLSGENQSLVKTLEKLFCNEQTEYCWGNKDM